MNLIGTLAIAMGAGWVSGINLYAAVATLGLLGRFAQLRLPGELEVLTSWWIIGIAATLYVVEFVADKIPYLDSAGMRYTHSSGYRLEPCSPLPLSVNSTAVFKLLLFYWAVDSL